MTDRIASYIASISLFKGLAQEHVEALAQITREEEYMGGETIFNEGDKGEGFYVLVSGQVKIFKLAADGKEQILHIFGPGEPFAEVPVFAGQHFPASAQVLKPSRALFFPRSAFIELIKKNPPLALNMLAVLSMRLRTLTQMVEDLSLREVPARLASYLLELSGRNKGTDDLVLDIGKGQLASLLGTIAETLSRTMAKMHRQGMIHLEGPRIRITNRKALEALAASEHRLFDHD
ncbi:MAG TPA: Crp/Fnr family transcriptional regulator [Thermodesulfovibrionia bacterium]|nr:Crp/Fnr family transcriptional regulator [Thermodesulfovibrionia bacterium]